MNSNESEQHHVYNEEGLAAARRKMKQQQKEASKSSNGSSSDISNHEEAGFYSQSAHPLTQQQQYYQYYQNNSYPQADPSNMAYLMSNQQQLGLSGRSTPSSTFYAPNNGAPTGQYVYQQQTLPAQQSPLQQGSASPPSSTTSPTISFPSLNNLDAAVSAANMNPAAFKEQLQLHVQTIGILVAEKAELQSKLHQMTKKCDKKQDECDELMGRLKASRQKIADLEKQTQNQSQVTGDSSFNASSSNEIEFLRNELNSKQLLIDEFKIRMSESNDRIAQKQQENQRLSQLSLELKSQLELLQMKLTQFNADDEDKTAQESHQNGHDKTAKLSEELNRSNKLVSELKESNASLEAKLKDAKEQLSQQKDQLKTEYQSYVEQFQRQIESLVDQINRMSDEREESFSKIDRLDQQVKSKEELIKAKDAEVQELKSRLAQQEADIVSKTVSPSTAAVSSSDKELLLENEIKYFKQQIEILVQEQTQMAQVIQDKEISIINLNKLVEKFESDREQHSKLLETLHNEKQTLSRAIHQNKELKEQLTELQDAFVNVTQKNLELTTQLQAEQFKLKQLADSPNSSALVQQLQLAQSAPSPAEKQPSHEPSPAGSDAKDGAVDDEWNSDDPNSSSEKKSESSLMQCIKERIEYLEKENKDLNDYIELMNKKIIDQHQKEQPTNGAVESSNEIVLDTIRKLTSERDNLVSQMQTMKAQYEQTLADSREKLASVDPNQPVVDQEFIKNMKLLEEKFNKVMVENAELKDKNQELEHTIDQLQFETETIADYISMYQVQREKLAQKYKDSLKDESIRSLSTQLQVNRLALGELSSYFNTLLKYINTETVAQESVPAAEGQEGGDFTTTNGADQTDIKAKRDFVVNQIDKLLMSLTENSSTTLNQVSLNQQNASSPNKPVPKKAQARKGHGHSHDHHGHSHDHGGHGHSHDHHEHDHEHDHDDQDGYIEANIEIDEEASMAAFRAHLVLCNNCQGELFIV